MFLFIKLTSYPPPSSLQRLRRPHFPTRRRSRHGGDPESESNGPDHHRRRDIAEEGLGRLKGPLHFFFWRKPHNEHGRVWAFRKSCKLDGGEGVLSVLSFIHQKCQKRSFDSIRRSGLWGPDLSISGKKIDSCCFREGKAG